MNEAIVLFDDSVDRGETQSGPFADFFRGEKRLEDAVSSCRIHPNSGVGYGENDVAASLNVGVEAAIRLIQIEHLRLNDKSTATGHRVPSIEAKIHEHLLHLRKNPLYGLKWHGHNFENDVFRDYFLDEAKQTAGDGIQIDGAGLQ